MEIQIEGTKPKNSMSAPVLRPTSYQDEFNGDEKSASVDVSQSFAQVLRLRFLLDRGSANDLARLFRQKPISPARASRYQRTTSSTLETRHGRPT